MDKFTVEVKETLSRSVEVQADSAYDAIAQAENQYRSKEIALDKMDSSEVTFTLGKDSMVLTKEIERVLVEWLPNSKYLFVGKDGKPTYQQYWDYNDDISTNMFEEIMEFAQKDLYNWDKENHSLENAILSYGWDNFWFEDSADIVDYNVAKEFFLAHQELFSIYGFDCVFDIEGTPIFDSLREVIMEYIDIDYNIKQLLKNTSNLNATLFFDSELFSDLDEAWNPNYEDFEDTNDNRKESFIGWLLKTQGYTIEELVDEEKRLKNPFLDKVWSELYDYRDLLGLDAVAIIPVSLDDIFNYKFKGNAVIKAGTTFGFFNAFVGSGTGLEIEIEKDIVLEDEIYQNTYLNPRERGQRGNWTITDTYGKLYGIKGGLAFHKNDEA